jgi:hypothetical protein
LSCVGDNGRVYLRIKIPKNKGNKKNIRWAHEYELRITDEKIPYNQSY